jgi:hypothetical protein
VQPYELISGRSVAFKLRDAACPDFAEAVRAIGPDLQVIGHVVFLSDGCDRKDHFAVVEVEGIHTPLIVPVACLTESTRATIDMEWPTVEKPAREAC